MKTVAILGGLGSQMTKYAFYLDVKKKCQNECCYIDTTPFHTLQMWNGYELNKVFGVEIKDIRSLFTSEQIQEQIDELKKTEFWKHNWNYADSISACSTSCLVAPERCERVWHTSPRNENVR